MQHSLTLARTSVLLLLLAWLSQEADVTALAPAEQLLQVFNSDYTFRLSFFNDALDVTTSK